MSSQKQSAYIITTFCIISLKLRSKLGVVSKLILDDDLSGIPQNYAGSNRIGGNLTPTEVCRRRRLYDYKTYCPLRNGYQHGWRQRCFLIRFC